MEIDEDGVEIAGYDVTVDVDDWRSMRAEIEGLREENKDLSEAWRSLLEMLGETQSSEISAKAEIERLRADKRRLKERCLALVRSYDETNFMRTADYHGDECDCFRCHVDHLRATLAGEK